MTREATGIVLAGGASRRMGQDKGGLVIGDTTALDRVISALSEVCSEVVVAARSPRSEPAPPATTYIYDPPGPSGPLIGVASGMRSASNESCVVVACDMPFVQPQLLLYLLDRLSGWDAVVPTLGDSPQPLQAAYSSSCLPAAEGLLARRDTSMFSLLKEVSVLHIGADECSRIDPAGLSGFNMNTLEDLELARRAATT